MHQLNLKTSLFFLGFFLIAISGWAQKDNLPFSRSEKKWFEQISIGGYMQVQYNRVLEHNSPVCEDCDDYLGVKRGFSLKRMRLKVSGYLGDYLYFYIQPDFSGSVDSEQNFAELKDAYMDVSLDKNREYRFRIGLSKVPFGFENLQSSSRRVPLDRSTSMKAIDGNRDLGVFFYYTPRAIQKRFSELKKSGLKGTGDYGMIGGGVFNGQNGSQLELNENLHVVARVSYPFKIGNQFIEPALQGYTGKYQLRQSKVGEGVVTTKSNLEYRDERAAVSLMVYPQPIGFQAEYNIGRGPKFNRASNTIQEASLHGGYAMLSYKAELYQQLFYPFIRYQYYDGDQKFEQDAESLAINDVAFGLEWRPLRNLEFTASYNLNNREYQNSAFPYDKQEGSLLRFQAQVSF